MDWYVEGPGRRVAYDDLTAIDWIFEYTKERQRKRLLYASGQGLAGHARRLLDASSVWLVLITTGVLVGIIAACIDITSNWLGDLKMGYCKNGPGGGRFYLNRSFCCWGHEGKHRIRTIDGYSTNVLCADLSQCLDWTPWRKALGVISSGGGFTVEYIFYILYSVLFPSLSSHAPFNNTHRSFSLFVLVSWSESTPSLPGTVVYRKSRLFLEASLSDASWALGPWQLNPSAWYVHSIPPYMRLLSMCLRSNSACRWRPVCGWVKKALLFMLLAVAPT